MEFDKTQLKSFGQYLEEAQNENTATPDEETYSEARVSEKTIETLVGRIKAKKAGHRLEFSLGSKTYGRSATLHWTAEKGGGESDIYRASSPQCLEAYIRGVLDQQSGLK